MTLQSSCLSFPSRWITGVPCVTVGTLQRAAGAQCGGSGGSGPASSPLSRPLLQGHTMAAMHPNTRTGWRNSPSCPRRHGLCVLPGLLAGKWLGEVTTGHSQRYDGGQGQWDLSLGELMCMRRGAGKLNDSVTRAWFGLGHYSCVKSTFAEIHVRCFAFFSLHCPHEMEPFTHNKKNLPQYQQLLFFNISF